MSDSWRPHGLEQARFMSIVPIMLSNISSSASLSPFCLQSFPVSVFSNELALLISWPKCWSFSISPSNEYSGFISLRIDWLDLLAAQGTRKSLLQHHSSKASIFQHSAFSLLYGPALISVHDYWKNHSFDYMDLCQQSDMFAF